MLIPKTLSPQWVNLLKDEFSKPYFLEIIKHYKQALQTHKNAVFPQNAIFPPNELIFNAFNLTPPESVRIVILGQDPYHGSIFTQDGEIPQAMGLSFSVPKVVPIPPSLKNIYKELENSLGICMPNHGDLTQWATKGVLLLNAILSVQKGTAGSHKHFGWETFTDSVIYALSTHFSGIVFMLWGNFAKKKISLIDSTKHAIITAPHPSPLARGFVGSGVFLQTNKALQDMGKMPMDWRIV